MKFLLFDMHTQPCARKFQEIYVVDEGCMEKTRSNSSDFLVQTRRVMCHMVSEEDPAGLERAICSTGGGKVAGVVVR